MDQTATMLHAFPPTDKLTIAQEMAPRANIIPQISLKKRRNFDLLAGFGYALLISIILTPADVKFYTQVRKL